MDNFKKLFGRNKEDGASRPSTPKSPKSPKSLRTRRSSSALRKKAASPPSTFSSAYDSVTEGKAPERGDRPVRGNAPSSISRTVSPRAPHLPNPVGTDVDDTFSSASFASFSSGLEPPTQVPATSKPQATILDPAPKPPPNTPAIDLMDPFKARSPTRPQEQPTRAASNTSPSYTRPTSGSYSITGAHDSPPSSFRDPLPDRNLAEEARVSPVPERNGRPLTSEPQYDTASNVALRPTSTATSQQHATHQRADKSLPTPSELQPPLPRQVPIADRLPASRQAHIPKLAIRSKESPQQDLYAQSTRLDVPDSTAHETTRHSASHLSQSHKDHVSQNRHTFQSPDMIDGKPLLVKDAKEAPDLSKFINIGRSEDTTVHTKWESPVLHETVVPEVHHVTEQRITRNIHTHDIYHRMLPVVDVQVLPTRHYLQDREGHLTEVPADRVPGRSEKPNWVVAETVSKGANTMKPRGFTARTFAEDEGSHRQWVGEDGVPRTETTWVHPPRVEGGAKATGQTMPAHFSADGVQLRSSGVGAQGDRLNTEQNEAAYKRDAEAVVAAAQSATKAQASTPSKASSQARMSAGLQAPRETAHSTTRSNERPSTPPSVSRESAVKAALTSAQKGQPSPLATSKQRMSPGGAAPANSRASPHAAAPEQGAKADGLTGGEHSVGAARAAMRNLQL